MDDNTKKNIKLGIAIVALILAAVITYFSYSGGGGGTDRLNRTLYMICKNKDCPEKEYEITEDEFREMIQMRVSQGGAGLVMGQRQVFECKHCGQETAYIAQKCEECGNFFSINYGVTDDYPDRCPKCGYSKIEKARGE